MTDLKITYLQQSAFYLEYGNHAMLIDPGKKEFGEKFKGDLIYITHKHSDHTKGAKEFLDLNVDAKIICNKQVAKNFSSYADRLIIANSNEEFILEPWHLKFIKGRHGVFRGVLNLGVIVSVGQYKFGHVGDSINFKGFENSLLNSIAVPISGLVTASPNQAIKELKKFEKPLPIVIPMHWLFRSPHSFCNKLKKELPNIKCIIPKKGKLIDFNMFN